MGTADQFSCPTTRVLATRAAPVAIASLLLWAATGCVVLPTGVSAHVDDHGHRRIDAAALRSMRPGKVTRGSVVGRLGRPNFELAGGRLLVYGWTQRQEFRFAWLFVDVADPMRRINGGRFAHEPEQTDFLALEFRDDGMLLRKRLKRKGRLNLRGTTTRDVFE